MLALRYALFAGIASLANLAVQGGILGLTGLPYRYGFALVAGTLCGLIVKYFLDRTWIFHDRTRSIRGQGRQFTLYTLTGVVTTAIFWASETAFYLAFGTVRLTQLGGALGLILGYVLKYHLDRRFVFTGSKDPPAG